jgi:hypothetical protein
MELTDNQKRIDIVARLVSEGAIDFNEAIDLLLKDQPPVFIYPVNQYPWNPNPIYNPWQITCQIQN